MLAGGWFIAGNVGTDRYITPIMDDQTEKTTNNEVVTGGLQGHLRSNSGWQGAKEGILIEDPRP